MNVPLVTRAYERLEEREERRLEDIQKGLEGRREETVKTLQQDALDKKIKEIHPELTPDNLPTIDREERNRVARSDAEAKYSAVIETEMAKARQETLQKKMEFLEGVSQPRSLKQNFNEESKGNGR